MGEAAAEVAVADVEAAEEPEDELAEGEAVSCRGCKYLHSFLGYANQQHCVRLQIGDFQHCVI